MSDEITEIIRVLQLTTYDEEEWDADNLTVMKKGLNAFQSKQQAAHDWLTVRMPRSFTYLMTLTTRPELTVGTQSCGYSGKAINIIIMRISGPK